MSLYVCEKKTETVQIFSGFEENCGFFFNILLFQGLCRLHRCRLRRM